VLDKTSYKIGWKLDLSDNFWWKSPMSNFRTICEVVCGVD